MVLAYDLLEGRCTIDIIITKFFPLCFKMAGSFENLKNTLRDWANDTVKKKKKSCRGIEQVREARRRKVKPLLAENGSEKYSSSLNQQSNKTKLTTKLVLVSQDCIALARIGQTLINKIFLRLIHLK